MRKTKFELKRLTDTYSIRCRNSLSWDVFLRWKMVNGAGGHDLRTMPSVYTLRMNNAQ